MNVLIKDPKSKKNQETKDGDQENTSGQENKTESFPWLVFFLLFTFVILMLSSFDNIQETRVDTLEASWNRLKDSRAKLHSGNKFTPEQLHLSLGANSTEVWVTWMTLEPVMCELVYSKVVYDGSRLDREISVTADMSYRRIEESDPKWIKATGRKYRTLFTHRAKMQNLKPGSLYVYRAQSYDCDRDGTSTFYSNTYHYSAKDLSNSRESVNLAIYGDLGLVNGQSIPRLTRDVDDGKYDVIIHNGDFAYDLNTRHGQVGDEFMRKIEPIAARVPYQTSVGNHEIAENFTHYNQRFTMIDSGGSVTNGQHNNFYYSFNVGPVHFVAFSTEFYYFLKDVGLEALHNQYEWLKQDLTLATSPAERAKRPWIVVFGHRPMYCSSRDRDDCSKDSNILRKGLPFLGTYALEKLFYDFGVDVEIYSHEHQYERFLPIYDGKVYNGTEDPEDPYFNPLAPVHFISGSAGCHERLDPFKGTPATGSIKQISDYGFTRLRASRCELSFEQISDDLYGRVVDEVSIKKTRQNFPVKSGENYDCTMAPEVAVECPYGWKSWLCPEQLLLMS